MANEYIRICNQKWSNLGQKGQMILKNGQKWSEIMSIWYMNDPFKAYGQMPIYEPCNYASNIAYYHTATEICAREGWNFPEYQVKAIGMTFAILGQGSAFFHGSETSNGGAADVRINDLFAYVAYQAAFEKVEPLDNSIIHQLRRAFINHLVSWCVKKAKLVKK